MARILVFWDSIAYGKNDIWWGWADRLKQSLWKKNSKRDLHNLWISADTSQDVAVRIVPEISARLKPEMIVVVAVWINDTAFIKESWDIRVSEESFQQAIGLIVEDVSQYNASLLFVWPTRVVENWISFSGSLWTAQYDNERIDTYDELLQEKLKEQNVPYLSMRNIVKESQLSDWLHPDGDWHERMFEVIEERLNENDWLS